MMVLLRCPGSWLAVLLLSVSCAATGVGSPGAEDADSSRPHERELDRSEFRLQWPFARGTGTLSCDRGAVIFQTEGVTYGLNDEAIKRGLTPATPLLMTQHRRPTNPLGRLRQGDRERIFSVAHGCASAKDAGRCRAGIRTQYEVSEAELEQILMEGRERTWPPLPPRRMSVEPIVAAGLRLCQ